MVAKERDLSFSRPYGWLLLLGGMGALDQGWRANTLIGDAIDTVMLNWVLQMRLSPSKRCVTAQLGGKTSVEADTHTYCDTIHIHPHIHTSKNQPKKQPEKGCRYVASAPRSSRVCISSKCNLRNVLASVVFGGKRSPIPVPCW